MEENEETKLRHEIADVEEKIRLKKLEIEQLQNVKVDLGNKLFVIRHNAHGGKA